MCSSRIWYVLIWIWWQLPVLTVAAEHRGPGIHHNNFEEHNDDMAMDMDMDSGRNTIFTRNGRGIILLGDSGSLLSRNSDSDSSDRIDENHDLDAHILPHDEEVEERSRREETPGPQASSAPEHGDTLQPKTHVPSKEKPTEVPKTDKTAPSES
jgi:hypothetical protein